MPRMPTLGEPEKKSPAGKLFAAALIAAAAAGGYWWKTHRLPGSSPIAQAISAPASAAAPNDATAAAPTTAQAAPAAAAAAPAASPIKHLSAQINGPLEGAIDAAAGSALGPALTQVVTRSLVWWIEMPGDLRRGDKLDVVYEERAGQEPLVYAVRYESSKFGKTFEAYRFQVPGDTFPRYYQPSGEELEMRLKSSPLNDYEQVTSRIRDGRHHKGIDFKTPVGSAVHATFAGVVTRKNWNWRGNGNCLEITEAGGIRKAMYLHLSELPKTIKPGDHIAQGQVIAQSGNSGHSFAPHLHYQLMQGEEKVLDPFDAAPAYRRSISAEAKPALDAEIHRLQAMMGSAVAKNP